MAAWLQPSSQKRALHPLGSKCAYLSVTLSLSSSGVHVPCCMHLCVQIINEYGAPQYALSLDVTSATTLVVEEDKAAIAQIVQDCCPITQGMVCNM